MILNALTIDVEDYFQVTGFAQHIRPADWDSFDLRVEASTRRILDRLGEAGVRATFFVLGWVARRCPQLVAEIADRGHEIASHGTWHQLVSRQTPAQFRTDVRASRARLEEIVGRSVTAYRAPSFSISPDCTWAFEVLVEEGFTVDSSVAVGRPHSCGHFAEQGTPFCIRTPSGSLWEYPLPAARVFGRSMPVGGGGFFRLWPYPWTRRALAGLNASGRPFAVYLHPWEFDPSQPRLNAGSRLRRWKHTVNLHRTEPRFVRLLGDFSFDSMSASLNAFRCKSTRQVALAAAA